MFMEHKVFPEGRERTPEAQDRGAGSPEDKTQSTEIKDLGDAGLTETVSGILQKVAMAERREVGHIVATSLRINRIMMRGHVRMGHSWQQRFWQRGEMLTPKLLMKM
jgi:hypothetical protein